MPLILGTNSIKDTGYNVANSCRFNDDDSPKLTKTVSGSSTTKGTFSVWVKRCSLGEQCLFATQAGSNEVRINFTSGDALTVFHHDGSYQTQLITNRLFRDFSAWYHILIVIDTTQGTDTNRVKFYINGTQDTSFSTANWPAEDSDSYWFQSADHFLGTEEIDSNYFDGYLAELVMCQGQALTPTSFGEFDEDSPTIWKPIDVSGLTFGTSGYYLDFEDSANLGNDANGGTDFTEANLAAVDQATDTPTNNFCTLNPLEAVTATTTYAQGNMQGTTSNAARATFAVTNGKWYWEQKFVNKEAMGGVMAYSGFRPNDYTINALIYGYGPNLVLNGVEPSGWADGTPDAMVDNDILNVALDCDNNRIAFGVNGAWLNATDGSGEWSGTTLNYYSISDGYDYAPAFRTGSGTNRESHFNFGGCPGFAISSGNADANGYGNFEYAVPSGFFALCTKNLAEYG